MKMKVLHQKIRQQTQSARHQNQSPQSAKFVVVVDGDVAFYSQSHPAAWAFVAAAGFGEIYRKCKLIE